MKASILSEAGHDCLSVKLDDPSFLAPICGTLVETDGDKETLSLIWSRRGSN